MTSKKINEIRDIFSSVDELSRDVYREARRSMPELNLPSDRQIANLFGSFGRFTTELKGDNMLFGDELTSSEIENLKETTRVKRMLMFGSFRKRYRWEPPRTIRGH